jgi:hypothetical protein
MDALKAFVIHTNMLERLPMSPPILEKALKEGKENGDPLATGQFAAVNIVLRDLAPKEEFLTPPEKLRSEIDSHEHLLWLRNLHVTIMTPIAALGEKNLDPNTPLRHTLGHYRSSRKVLGPRVMPSPFAIKRLLHRWLLDISQFNKDMSYKLKHPFMLSKMDLIAMAERAYTANLQLCCIKPFEDGSNRIGRLVENALRLNWGLPWKIIADGEKDKLLSDIFEMQKKYPENV